MAASRTLQDLSAIFPHLFKYPSKITLFHFALLTFSDILMLHISLSSIKSSRQQKHLCPVNKQIFCFASSICVNNTQKWLNRIGAEENLIPYLLVGFSRRKFSKKSIPFIVACKLHNYFFFLNDALTLPDLPWRPPPPPLGSGGEMIFVSSARQGGNC